MGKSLEPYMTAFPAPETVFAGDVAAHRRVLQPLLSVDASAIDPSWSGKLHFVTPLEPYDGLLGEETDAFHSGYCVLNWIAFHVSNSTYTFLGDFRYFKINAEGGEWLEKDYAAKNASYEESKKSFAKTKKLLAPMNRTVAVDWIEQIGGDAPDANWCAFGLKVEVDDAGGAHPLTADGRHFRHVGSLQGDHYRENCADQILLFFDPSTSTAVLTFDWT